MANAWETGRNIVRGVVLAAMVGLPGCNNNGAIGPDMPQPQRTIVATGGQASETLAQHPLDKEDKQNIQTTEGIIRSYLVPKPKDTFLERTLEKLNTIQTKEELVRYLTVSDDPNNYRRTYNVLPGLLPPRRTSSTENQHSQQPPPLITIVEGPRYEQFTYQAAQTTQFSETLQQIQHELTEGKRPPPDRSWSASSDDLSASITVTDPRTNVNTLYVINRGEVQITTTKNPHIQTQKGYV